MIEHGIPWLSVDSRHAGLERRVKEELLQRRFGTLLQLAEQRRPEQCVGESPATAALSDGSPAAERPKSAPSAGRERPGKTAAARSFALPEQTCSWDKACEQ